MNSIDQKIGRLRLKASDNLSRRVHTGIDERLTNEQTTTVLTIGRTKMTHSMLKLAAAAAVVFAGLLGVSTLNGPHSSAVAWAQIPDHIQTIDTFMFRLAIRVHGKDGATSPGPQGGEFTFYLSEQHGFRMDIGGGGTVVSWYVPPEQDTLTMVIPAQKTWSRTPLPPDQRGKMPDEYEDPAEFVRGFLARPYKELGRSVIDGIEVEGIEVTNPPLKEKDGKLENSVGRMWVEVKTELPVRIEIEGTADKATVQWRMEFRWGEAVDPKVFDPNIPSDYTPLVP
ncbi:MAG: hypothetical protein MUC88_20280 [Planctomycetes bacterium]|jgi:outer membrane lipoprotein-sorting protein|nr:hypothetical protein [Planctomycetota bacterium]